MGPPAKDALFWAAWSAIGCGPAAITIWRLFHEEVEEMATWVTGRGDFECLHHHRGNRGLGGSGRGSHRPGAGKRGGHRWRHHGSRALSEAVSLASRRGVSHVGTSGYQQSHANF